MSSYTRPATLLLQEGVRRRDERRTSEESPASPFPALISYAARVYGGASRTSPGEENPWTRNRPGARKKDKKYSRVS
jgi:hypothetical protein